MRSYLNRIFFKWVPSKNYAPKELLQLSSPAEQIVDLQFKVHEKIDTKRNKNKKMCCINIILYEMHIA